VSARLHRPGEARPSNRSQRRAEGGVNREHELVTGERIRQIGFRVVICPSAKSASVP
jgi:hypothetical protein